MNNRRYLRSAALLLAALIALAVPLLIAGCSPSGVNLGQEAPDFSLMNLEGEIVSLSDYRGSPVLINFWASWCGPCRDEMPFLQQVHDDSQWKATGLVILTVNVNESRETIINFLDENQLFMEVLIDSNQKVTELYNVRAIPESFLISRDGKLRHRVMGAFPGVEALEGALRIITEE